MQAKYKTTIRHANTQLVLLTDQPPTRNDIRGAMIPIAQLLSRNAIPGEDKPLHSGKNLKSLMAKNRDGGDDYEDGTITIEQSIRSLD